MKKEPCHDCAFTPGTEAASYQPTAISAGLCLVSREPFFCHIDKQPDGQEAICRGWLRECVKREADGKYQDPQLVEFAQALSDFWSAYSEPFKVLKG